MHICHIVFRFDIGGLENGIVNILNHLPEVGYRHSILCLSGYNPEFFARIRAGGVAIHTLNKRPGKDIGYLKRLYGLLRALRPDIVHTRNLNTLECQAVAWLAGVPVRIHGEHGWDSGDARTRRKPALIRKVFSPLISRYVALSAETEGYLSTRVGISPRRIERICNGVDIDRFRPGRPLAAASPTEATLVIGSIGRLAEVKNHQLLIRAFARLLERAGSRSERLHLVIVGDGPCRERLVTLVRSLDIEDRVSLPGASDNVPEAMSGLSLYVQPSCAEGISNTILEAMASGLAVISTDVGGARELVRPGFNGEITGNGNVEALVEALWRYVENPELLRLHGCNSRLRAEQDFSLATMAERYHRLYQGRSHASGSESHPPVAER
ncbi:TIGR03088 family PEP-CTERM/XrtA system glycosyltransferase [Marinobacterium aestuariivivens]|uniref:TIGR03088 family PEP-CTERM/XrtA system glycosyltransferase n=1 Tax=Marinobacterium aestuariivivens TaxID=1698799 RepID=A0ABW1ZVJ3_9GAMM